MPNNYVIINGELHHSDELYHWKYIKRERINGKWRYYYKDEAKIKGLESAKQKAKADMVDYGNKAFDKEFEIERKERKNPSTGLTTKERLLEYKADNLTLDVYSTARLDAGKRFVETSEKLRKAKIKAVVPRLIAKGLNAVSNLFNKLFKKK